MNKVAIVVMTDTEGGEALGRMVNAMSAAKEFAQAGDELKVAFTGAGTKWIGELSKPGHKLHADYRAIESHVAGACGYCADAFGVSDTVKAAGVCRLEDFGANMSFRKLMAEGYQVMTF